MRFTVGAIPLLLWVAAIAASTSDSTIRVQTTAVIGLYFGSLVFTGYVQIFLADGITHQMFFGTREVRKASLRAR